MPVREYLNPNSQRTQNIIYLNQKLTRLKICDLLYHILLLQSYIIMYMQIGTCYLQNNYNLLTANNIMQNTNTIRNKDLHNTEQQNKLTH